MLTIDSNLNNCCFLVEFCLLDQKPGLFRFLLCNLLLLDSSCELPEHYNVSLPPKLLWVSEPDYVGGQVVPSKSEVGDANVIKDKAKLIGASHKLLICPGADLKHEVLVTVIWNLVTQ